MARYANSILGLAFVTALSLQGCSDSKGQLSTTVAKTPHAQSTLIELNENGLIPHELRTYQYAINPSCTLDVVTRLNGSPYGHLSIDLTATQFERFDFARGLGHAVRVATDMTHPNLFTSLSNEKVERVMELLEVLRKECSAQK